MVNTGARQLGRSKGKDLGRKRIERCWVSREERVRNENPQWLCKSREHLKSLFYTFSGMCFCVTTGGRETCFGILSLVKSFKQFTLNHFCSG